MVTKRALPSESIWPVRTHVPDEHEGDILATTDDHAQIVFGADAVLKIHARRQGFTWLVRGETQILYPRADGSIGSLYPDVLVAHDVDIPGTDPYDVRAVGKPPELIVEVISRETAKKDLGVKRTAYAEMGVQEYVTFDPRPRKGLALVGHRLVRPGEYVVIPPHPLGGLWLETIGLRVEAEGAEQAAKRGPRLRFYTAAGTPLLHVEEEAETRQRAESERQAEQEARERAEQERDALAADNERLRQLLASRGIDMNGSG